MTASVPNLNTEELRMYAKRLRLSNLRANCSDIIHRAQIDKPTYLELISTILKDELNTRQKNDLLRRMRQAKLPKNCDLDHFDFNHSAGITKSQLQQMRALFITMEGLVNILRTKEVSSSAMNAYSSILKCNLIGIDDIMLMPMKKEEAVAFFNLVNNLHEKTSIIITTNKAPTEWGGGEKKSFRMKSLPRHCWTCSYTGVML